MDPASLEQAISQVSGATLETSTLEEAKLAIENGRASAFLIRDKKAPLSLGITALVIFPHYRPEQIIAAAREGYKIPSGITRHIIPYRALNINIPLEVVAADWDLDRKQAWLRDWLMERMAASAIRFYKETTFLLTSKGFLS